MLTPLLSKFEHSTNFCSLLRLFCEGNQLLTLSFKGVSEEMKGWMSESQCYPYLI